MGVFICSYSLLLLAHNASPDATEEHTGYTALHAAGEGRASLLAQGVAVMVGIQANDFAIMCMTTPADAMPVYAVSGFTFSVAA